MRTLWDEKPGLLKRLALLVHPGTVPKRAREPVGCDATRWTVHDYRTMHQRAVQGIRDYTDLAFRRPLTADELFNVRGCITTLEMVERALTEMAAGG